MATQVGVGYVQLVPTAKDFSDKVKREIGDTGKRVGEKVGRDIGDGINSASGRVSNAGKEHGKRYGDMFSGQAKMLIGAAITAAVALGARSLAQFGRESLTAASDLGEVNAAIGQVFGPDAAAELKEWAKTAAKSLGQTQKQALDAAKNFGIFGKAAGLSGKDLSGFSTKFAALATDLASFNNTTPEEAIEALGAGLRGESEPLRRYGVLLDDATLKARATTMGIYDGNGALTSQQKILASYQEILAQTSTQQGDFARTSGGFANQSRILAATWEDLKAKAGSALLPIAEKYMPMLTGALDKLSVWVSANMPRIQAAISGFIDKVAVAVGAAVQWVRDNWGSIQAVAAAAGDALKALWDKVSLVITKFAELDTGTQTSVAGIAGVAAVASQVAPGLAGLVPLITNPWGLAAGAVALAAGGIAFELKKLYDSDAEFKAQWDAMWEDMKIAVGEFSEVWKNDLYPALKEIMPYIGDVVIVMLRQQADAIMVWASAIRTAASAVRDLRREVGSTSDPAKANALLNPEGRSGFSAFLSMPGDQTIGRFMAGGGGVGGTGVRDTVPAMLTPGEFVLNRRMVAQAGGIGRLEDWRQGGSTPGGITVEALTINNPVAEPASDSLPRAIRKLAYVGGAA